MTVEVEKHYKQGTYARVKLNRFDSKSEEKVCLILNRILKDYDLEKYMQIRLTPQQALDNYVEVKTEAYKNYYMNKYKWMKFDFIFEQVYESKNRMNYIPVAVVEFDGPNHESDKQKEIDYYKNGIVSDIGASIVRIEYNKLENLNEIDLRKEYEDEIILAIIKGYFTKSVNNRKREDLVNESNIRRFDRLVREYTKAGSNNEKEKYYNNMLRLLYFSKETVYSDAN